MNQTVSRNVGIGYYVRAKKEVEHALKPREIKYAVDLRELSIYLGIQKKLYWWKRLLNIYLQRMLKIHFQYKEQLSIVNCQTDLK